MISSNKVFSYHNTVDSSNKGDAILLKRRLNFEGFNEILSLIHRSSSLYNNLGNAVDIFGDSLHNTKSKSIV